MVKSRILYIFALAILLALTSTPAFADIDFSFTASAGSPFNFIEVAIASNPAPGNTLGTPALVDIVDFDVPSTTWSPVASSSTVAVAEGSGPSTLVDFDVAFHSSTMPNLLVLDVWLANGPNPYDLVSVGDQKYTYHTSNGQFVPTLGGPALPAPVDVPEARALLLLVTMLAGVAGAAKLRLV